MARSRASDSRDRGLPPELPFEKALERPERLEGGDLELEAALAAFEEGVLLTRRCAEQLREAERRIEVLTQESDGWVERDFEMAEGED
jgi:exodeoxyribonuclease VII small subunit